MKKFIKIIAVVIAAVFCLQITTFASTHTPDDPVTVKFYIKNRVYTVSNVVFPEGEWEFRSKYYSVSLGASMDISPDTKNPTASGSTMKSGYGINETVNAWVLGNFTKNYCLIWQNLLKLCGFQKSM